ncbi:MAG: hypothetical protein ACE5NM_09685 [Sedimentisphaerales bacterium]
MRLTIEQRLESLERDVVVLQDTMKLLHKLLKQQRELINDYITQKVTSAKFSDKESEEDARPEDALYIFTCRQRFDRIEKEIDKVRKMIEDSKAGLKAG